MLATACHSFLSVFTRADYAYAMTEGLTAPEYAPDGKASDEAAALYQWLVRELQIENGRK